MYDKPLIIGCDHAAYQAKEQLKQFFAEKGIEVTDAGCFSEESVHYPEFAKTLAKAVQCGAFERGVLLCGTGIGMSLAANRFKGVRATLVHDEFTATACREHNDSNILVTGGDAMTEEELKAVVETWLSTPFSNYPRHVRRLEKLYRRGRLTKESINKRGYNKFLDMSGDTAVVINRERIAQDEAWDGLKGYLTNPGISHDDIFTAYHNLWNVERAFRIAKSKIEIRPMFHFTRRRIEAHICICFVALKVYKELERRLKRANIGMSVDKVLNMAKTVTTIVFRLPESGKTFTKTMPMKRHQRIAKLFTDEFWVAQ